MEPGQKKKQKRRPGGQPGNSNARKHGFYSYSLNPDEIEQFKFLTEVRQIDPEVAVFHIKYRAIFERGELNAQAIDAAVKYLAGYYRAKFRLSKSDTGVIKQLLKRILGTHAIMTKANPESFSWEFK
jgi:hypothetical protein